jgi:hypothetical protein
MDETERVAIVDKEDPTKIVNVVESIDFPGTYGIVLLNPDGSNI